MSKPERFTNATGAPVLDRRPGTRGNRCGARYPRVCSQVLKRRSTGVVAGLIRRLPAKTAKTSRPEVKAFMPKPIWNMSEQQERSPQSSNFPSIIVELPGA